VRPRNEEVQNEAAVDVNSADGVEEDDENAVQEENNLGEGENVFVQQGAERIVQNENPNPSDANEATRHAPNGNVDIPQDMGHEVI
jgi:hypothetical protein